MTEPEDKRNVHQRLAAAMHNCKYIQKEKKQGMSYMIVSHDDVTAKVRPALLEQGIVYYPVSLTRVQGGSQGDITAIDMAVRFVNIDKPDDYFDVQTCGYGKDSQDKGPGKAMSYAVKYALLKAMGLETGEDADLPDTQPNKPINPQVDYGKDNKTLQGTLVNEINSIQDRSILVSWYDERFPVAETLPAEMLALVSQQYENRMTFLTNGGKPEKKFKFVDVKQMDEFGQVAKTEISRCDTIAELTKWTEDNKHVTDALETKRKARMNEIVNERAAAIQAAARNTMEAG